MEDARICMGMAEQVPRCVWNHMSSELRSGPPMAVGGPIRWLMFPTIFAEYFHWLHIAPTPYDRQINFWVIERLTRTHAAEATEVFQSSPPFVGIRML